MQTRRKVAGFPTIPAEEFARRMAAFREKMAQVGFDLVIAYSSYIDPATVRYFTDFSPINENGALLIPLQGEPILCSGQACHEWSKFKSKVKDIRIMPEVGEVSGVEYEIKVSDFTDLFQELRGKYRIQKIGTVGQLTFPQVIFSKLQQAFPAAEISSAEKILFELRMKKSDRELDCIRKAGEIISASFDFAVRRMKPGKTELDVEADLTSQMLRLGAEDHTLSWAPMVPSGQQHSNLCMNRNFLKKLERGEIINVDAGALYEGYNAVICTPVVLGRVPQEMRQAIRVAWDGQRRVAEQFKPGATAKQLYRLYSDYLTEKGYRQFSPYGSVHSLGMLECEPPFFSATKDVALQEGSVVAIDAYFANMPWGSFRIEDTFIVRAEGPEMVTTFNQDYLKRYL
jgi:Xaa-Pro aminopeptidase